MAINLKKTVSNNFALVGVLLSCGMASVPTVASACGLSGADIDTGAFHHLPKKLTPEYCYLNQIDLRLN